MAKYNENEDLENKEIDISEDSIAEASSFIKFLGTLKELRDSEGFSAEENPEVISAIEKSEFVLEKIQNSGEEPDEEDISDISEEVKDIDGLLQNLNPKGTKSKELSELTSRISEGIASVGSFVNALQDKSTAKKQIREAKQSINAITEPEGIKPFKRSVNLANAIRAAKQDLSPVNQELATQGLRADVLDQYNKDINTAKIASGGQAGAFGSLSQSAANRRLRNALAIQDAKRQVRREATGRLDNLTGAEITENRASSHVDINRANLDDRVYARESEAAGRALSSGILNNRTANLEMINSLNQSSPYIAKGFQAAGSGIKDLAQRYRQRRLGQGQSPNQVSKLYSFNNEDDIINFGTELDTSLNNFYN